MSAVVCPAILAADKQEYKTEMDKVAGYAHRIQIDLTDREFAKSKTIAPHEIWWPVGVRADIHLMYEQPLGATRQLLSHRPHLIIVHAESHGNFKEFAQMCKAHGVKVGVALLPKTPPVFIYSALDQLDHVLIFSGELGRYGGHADLTLLQKAAALKQQKSNIEIGWDGGINDQNLAALILGGVDVLNVGGFLQKAENPYKVYKTLQRIAAETGTT